MIRRVRLVIIGSGFAGSILARIAHRLGIDVVLIERGHHPRFALGESSTPLGNLALKNRVIDSAFSADGSRLFLAGMTGQGRDAKVTAPYGTIDVCDVTA